MGWLTGAAALAFISLATPEARPANSMDTVLAGPMVGHVTDSSASIWAYAGQEPDFRIRYWREGLSESESLSVRMMVSAAERYAMRATLGQLKDDARYGFQLVDAVSDSAVRAGSFRTAPKAGAPVKFKMAFSSCMNWKLHPAQPAWKIMLADTPSFQILIGDNVYADTTDRELIWSHHLRQRRVPEFAETIARIPTYATWDDHDYGRDDSDSSLAGRENSLDAFREVWANPHAGTSETPGVFHKFSWGDVEFFVLDERYHRTPNSAPDTGGKTMLGAGQLQWLKEGLSQSKAVFKVIVSASTVNSSEDKDDWQSFQSEWKGLIGFLIKEEIKGVLLLTGDTHTRKVVPHYAAQSGGYMYWEIISSGIAARKATLESGAERDGFVFLEFNTLLKDPEMHISLVEDDGRVKLTRTLSASEMRPDTTAPRVSVTPEGGTFMGRVRVTAEADKPSKILYAFNGDSLNGESATYSGPIDIDSTATLKFMALDRVGYRSKVKEVAFTLLEESFPTSSRGDRIQFHIPGPYIEVTGDGESRLRVSVVDVVGRLRDRVFEGKVYSGTPYRLRLNSGNLEPGLYFLIVRHDGGVLRKPIYFLSKAHEMNFDVRVNPGHSSD